MLASVARVALFPSESASAARQSRFVCLDAWRRQETLDIYLADRGVHTGGILVAEACWHAVTVDACLIQHSILRTRAQQVAVRRVCCCCARWLYATPCRMSFLLLNRIVGFCLSMWSPSVPVCCLGILVRV